MEDKRIASLNDELLKRIVNRIIIKSCDLPGLGLYHGKMGLVVFFFHYAAFTKRSIYKKFAEQLLDELFEDIHNQLTFDLETGYCGIGWGIEYLSQCNFIDGSTNEILESVDDKIMEWNIKRVSDLSLNRGVAGIFHYVLCRIKNKSSICPFDDEFLSDLEFVASNSYEVCDDELRELFDDFREWLKSGDLKYNPLSLLLKIAQSHIKDKTQDLCDYNLGIGGGCAGYVLEQVLFYK